MRSANAIAQSSPASSVTDFRLKHMRSYPIYMLATAHTIASFLKCMQKKWPNSGNYGPLLGNSLQIALLRLPCIIYRHPPYARLGSAATLRLPVACFNTQYPSPYPRHCAGGLTVGSFRCGSSISFSGNTSHAPTTLCCCCTHTLTSTHWFPRCPAVRVKPYGQQHTTNWGFPLTPTPALCLPYHDCRGAMSS